jgi:hypothetical protein
MSNGTPFVINIVIVPIKNALFCYRSTRQCQQIQNAEQKTMIRCWETHTARFIVVFLSKAACSNVFSSVLCACLCNSNSFRLVRLSGAAERQLSHAERHGKHPRAVFYLNSREDFNFVYGGSFFSLAIVVVELAR